MNILLDISHPAHVHLFKNTYWKLVEKGHNVYVTVKDIQSAKKLLQKYGIKYIDLGIKKDTIVGKAIRQLAYNIHVYRLIKRYKIEIGVSSSITLSQISKFTKLKSIVLDDDDDHVEPLFVRFGHPFSDIILTPDSISRKSKNSLYYAGTHEMAYLHPNYFSPEPDILKEVGLHQDDKYFVLRFVAMKGHHDIGHKGITVDQKRKLIDVIKPNGKIFITSENEIESDLEEYRIPISPEKIHSFLYYSSMFIGDSQTMTSEAALLGVPALKCNSFSGVLSVPNELENKYELCYSYTPDKFDDLIAKIVELLKRDNIKQEWQLKKDNFINDKIDVTKFLVWFIEKYPESMIEFKKNPNIQYQFK